jgi:hypothetical protein
MKRFFFDFMTNERSLYDYRGDEFVSPQSAIEFAHATAQVLKHSLSGDWAGWSVVVRNAEGEKFFSLPVGPPETIAA